MERHSREEYFVHGESDAGNVSAHARPVAGGLSVSRSGCCGQGPGAMKFSRIGPRGLVLDVEILRTVARAMTAASGSRAQPESAIPAGYTYLGQFVDHDLTLDMTPIEFGLPAPDGSLVQGRTPTLDLDSLYGKGPWDPDDDRLYLRSRTDTMDRGSFALGVTAPISTPPGVPEGQFPADAGTNVTFGGYDLPRVANGPDKASRQLADIPDPRNDENLAVAQIHLALMQFHNRVAQDLRDRGERGTDIYDRARGTVVKHYQWMLRHDYLPRIVEAGIVEDVFRQGRKFVDPFVRGRSVTARMPLEFSVAAFRLGHSMVRADYSWNRFFQHGGVGGQATLGQLFTFSGTSGNFNPLAPVDDKTVGNFEQLPSNWCIDYRRFFDFSGTCTSGVTPPDGINVAKRIDTLVTNPLALLPLGSFDATEPPADPDERNLAFRNLVRASMVTLATGQQMAQQMGVLELSADDILYGDGTGVRLDDLDPDDAALFAEHTPLWFYILREAELNGGTLTGVGGRIVAEVFHQAIENSRHSIIRDWRFRPYLGANHLTFGMADLLLYAFKDASGLNPLGDAPPVVAEKVDPAEAARIANRPHLIAVPVDVTGAANPATST